MIRESRVKEGQLTFGGATPMDFSCQPTNVRLTPTVDTEDAVETLCGDSIAASPSKTTWTLNGSAIQDFDDPTGFVMFAFDNHAQTVPFTWTPNPTSGTWSGDVIVTALEIGGDVNARLSADFAWSIMGTPVLTP